MADIKTTYMGISLGSPMIVGACSLSKKLDNFKVAQDAGAGAIVVYSLFQEQIERESLELSKELEIGSDSFAESLSYFPKLDHAGTREHIMWIEKARKLVHMPIIGSLNAYSLGNWVEYAVELENAGCNALELNLYSVETDINVTSTEIENKSLDIISEVVSMVNIPVAVKLSPWYTSCAKFASNVVNAGASGLVLFNRFYQPTIDPKSESIQTTLSLSRSEDTRLPLRWIAILSNKLKVDIAASTGVHSADEVIMHLLAGANAVQCVSTLLLNGIDYISKMDNELNSWMDSKGYKKLSDFKGMLSQKNISVQNNYERSQYSSVLNSFVD